MEFRLRKATYADFDAINALFVEMLRFIYPNAEARGYAPGDLDYYFSGGADWICLAETEAGIAGFIAVEVHYEEENYIYYDDFCVTGCCRGMGMGTALMTAAEDYGRSMGILTAALHVDKRNAPARRFYEKRGFSVLRDEGDRLCLVKHITE